MSKYFNGWTIVFGVSILFLLCWLGLIFYYGMPYGDQSSPGTFGDQFGAVNALFSALALVGVIYTLIQQQQEMKAQRREFMNSRAYTLAYKQVELINELYNRNTYEEGAQDDELRGHSLYNYISRLYNRTQSFEFFEKMFNNHSEELVPFLRVLANSCDLVVRLHKERMTPEDSNILFNIIRYNTDKSIWKMISVIKHQDLNNESINENIRSLYKESIERINRFNEIYYKIKKDADEIDRQ